VVVNRRALVPLSVLLAACEPAPAPDIRVPGARPIAYEAIRDASGVLGYAEALLGPGIATGYVASVGPGTSHADARSVVGAWELPATTRAEDLVRILGSHGTLNRVGTYRAGQLWIADYRTPGSYPVRLLLIDGNNPTFAETAAPEVRPGPHVYLLAYRKP